MPLSTTAPLADTEQTKPGQPRVEIPVTASEAPPSRRRARAPEADEAGGEDFAPVHLDDRTPRMEPWLWVLLASAAPALVALYVPHAMRPALFVVTGALMLAGFVMLFVQERRSAARRRAALEPRP